MSKSIFEAIIANGFIADNEQVEQLAAIVATGVQGNGTYLRVLVAHTHQALHVLNKTTKAGLLATIGEVHNALYLSVLKGVADESVALPERNRRATFARSAASTLRKFVARGGDIRRLEPAEVTKAALRDYGRRVPTGTRVQRSLQRSGDAVLRAAQRLAKENPEEARKRLQALRAKIDDTIGKLAKVRSVRRLPRGVRMPRQHSNGRAVQPPGVMH